MSPLTTGGIFKAVNPCEMHYSREDKMQVQMEKQLSFMRDFCFALFCFPQKESINQLASLCLPLYNTGRFPKGEKPPSLSDWRAAWVWAVHTTKGVATCGAHSLSSHFRASFTSSAAALAGLCSRARHASATLLSVWAPALEALPRTQCHSVNARGSGDTHSDN